MITLFRIMRIWQLKTKWRLALWQYADQQLMDFIDNPKQIKERIQKEFIGAVAEILHNEQNFDPDSDVIVKK